MYGILLAVVVGYWTRLVSEEAALRAGGIVFGLLSLFFLAALRPWNWKYYSVPAKRR
jgi:hypothetical protein